MINKKKKWLLILILSAVGGVVISMVLLGSKEQGDKETYDFYAGQCRAEVAAYFGDMYGVNLGSNETEWQQKYNDEIPAELLDEKVKEAMGYDEALRQLALTYGISPMLTIEEMQQNLEEFNEQRAWKLSQGEVVYGLEEFGMEEFYLENRGYAESSLIEAIKEDSIHNHRDLLYQYYETLEASELISRQGATLRALIIDPEEFDSHPKEAKAALELVKEAATTDTEVSVEELSTLCGFPVSEKELVLDSKALSREDVRSAELLRLAEEQNCFIAPLGDTTNYYCVYQTVERLEVKKPDFEEALTTTAIMYANKIFEQEISKIVNQ